MEPIYPYIFFQFIEWFYCPPHLSPSVKFLIWDNFFHQHLIVSVKGVAITFYGFLAKVDLLLCNWKKQITNLTTWKKSGWFNQVKKGIEQLIVSLHLAYPEISSRLGALKYQSDFFFYPVAACGVTLWSNLTKIQCTYRRLYVSTNFAMLGRKDCLCLAWFPKLNILLRKAFGLKMW